MEVQAQNITPILPLEKVQNEIFGVKLTEAQRMDLSLGKEVFLENMKVGNTLQDGKIQFALDKNGEVQTKFNFKEPYLEVPKKVLDYHLTDEEFKSLNSGNEIKIKSDGQDFFVKIDSDLNKVVVRSKSEIDSMPVIGEYKLSDKEQKELISGKRLEPKVYKGKTGYITANVELSPDKKGIVFTNVKQVSDSEVKELIERYNQSNISKVEKAQETKTELSVSDLYKAVDTKDFLTLEKGNKQGLETKEVLTYIEKKSDLSDIEKFSMIALLEHKENKNEAITGKENLGKDSIVKEPLIKTDKPIAVKPSIPNSLGM